MSEGNQEEVYRERSYRERTGVIESMWDRDRRT